MIKDIFNWSNLSKWRSEIYGLSILWIVIYHVFQAFPKIQFNWTGAYIFRNGDVGVDVFLFLSAISLYFSLRNSKKEHKIKDFYKKRFHKILQVYFFFCVPYLAFKHLIYVYEPKIFLEQITFTRSGMGSFWFLACIMICYLIYPLFFHFIETKQEKKIIYITLGYILFLFLFATYFKSYFKIFEIGLGRLPIFIIGTLFGKKVYEKQPMNKKAVFLLLVLLLCRGPIFYFLDRIPYVKLYHTIFSRLYMGVLAVGVIDLMIIIFELFDLRVFKKFLHWIGQFTLEIYVIHIALRRIFMDIFKIRISKVSFIFLFLILFTILSILLGKLLSLLFQELSRKKKVHKT